MPARKAPSASDRPTAWVAQAEASTASNTASENSSAERTEAIDEKQRPQQPASGGKHQQQRENRDADRRSRCAGAGALARRRSSAETKARNSGKLRS